MNADGNGDRTDIERDASERMRELGRRSGEARRRKKAEREREQLEPLTDREQAKAALRRALDGGNRAAMVAAAKALIEFDRTPEVGTVTVEDAREQLLARFDQIDEHRQAAIEDGRAEACPTCGAYIDKDAARGGSPGSVERLRHLVDGDDIADSEAVMRGGSGSGSVSHADGRVTPGDKGAPPSALTFSRASRANFRRAVGAGCGGAACQVVGAVWPVGLTAAARGRRLVRSAGACVVPSRPFVWIRPTRESTLHRSEVMVAA